MHEVAKVLKFQPELKIPLALRPKSQNIKQKQYCNKLNEDFKLGPHFKKIFKRKDGRRGAGATILEQPLVTEKGKERIYP